MKKIYNNFIAISVFVILISCNKYETNKFEQGSLMISSTSFDFIGEEHNNGLDYVFSTTIAKNNSLTSDDVLNTVDRYVYEISPLFKGSTDNRNDLFNNETRSLLKSAVSSKSIIINRAFLLNKLTTNQFNFIEKLDMIFSITSIDLQLKEISSLKEEAISKLNDNEIAFVLSTLSLAESSLKYCSSDKGALWMNSILQIGNSRAAKLQTNISRENISNVIKSNKIDWHNVAVADVAAFLIGFPSGINAGAVIGGVTAGIASGGIAAGVGAILGGVVGGSASGLASAISASSVVLAAEIIVDWF